MLQSIRLTLQSHADTKVEFHPGVNYIIGKSRQGKTAIFRGIVKLGWNSPIRGMERWIHKHDPRNTTRVEVKTTDGHATAWEGTSPQRYIVDGDELSGFGQGVPQAVTDALNLGELNISGQHDRPFLLFDTPGEVARTLNRVVHLDAIDKALAAHMSDKRHNDQETKAREGQLSELRQQEAGFPDLDAGAEFLDLLEAQEREMARKKTMGEGLERLQGQLIWLRATLAHAQVAVTVPQRLACLSGLESTMESRHNKLKSLISIQDQLCTIKSDMAHACIPKRVPGRLVILTGLQSDMESKSDALRGLTTISDHLQTIRFGLSLLTPGLAKDAQVSECLAKNNLIQAKKKHLSRLTLLTEQITISRQGLIEKQAIIREREAELKQEFGDQCPLCGQEIKWK